MVILQVIVGCQRVAPPSSWYVQRGVSVPPYVRRENSLPVRKKYRCVQYYRYLKCPHFLPRKKYWCHCLLLGLFLSGFSIRSLTLPVASLMALVLWLIAGYTPLKTAIETTTPAMSSRTVAITLSISLPPDRLGQVKLARPICYSYPVNPPVLLEKGVAVGTWDDLRWYYARYHSRYRYHYRDRYR